MDASEEQALSAETKAIELQDEIKAQADAAKAQEEQSRLAEIEKAIQAERWRKHDERKAKALDSQNRIVFEFDGVIINSIVFDVDDEEDLSPFADEILVEVETVDNPVSTRDDEFNYGGGEEGGESYNYENDNNNVNEDENEDEEGDDNDDDDNNSNDEEEEDDNDES